MKNPEPECAAAQPNAFAEALHRVTVFAIYGTSAFAALLVLTLPVAHANLIALLSTGAIFATFGSAIATIATTWERDLIERVRTNVDIFYHDIVRQETAWRRWPFLHRSRSRRLMDGVVHQTILVNPEVKLDVGTHLITVQLPTVLEDFFDLPLLRNYSRLTRFRSAAHTTLNRREKGKTNPETGLERGDEYMAYECMYDIWKSIFIFRAARYATHLGSGLTISGAIVTAILLGRS